MTQRPFPILPEDITPAWLQQSGAVDGPMSGISATRIGQDEGFSGCRLYRLALDGQAVSLVAKMSPADPVRATRMAAANAREVAFYAAQGQAPDLPIPRCRLARHDAASGASLLILQDLGGDRAVSFAAGLGVRDAGLALRALGTLHARGWDGDAHHDGGNLQQSHPFHTLWPAYLDHIGPALPPALRALGDRIAADPEAACAKMNGTGPQTRLHGDPQADNLRFGDGAEGPMARLIDWQMTGRGAAIADVGYLLISSLSPTLRRANEADLIALWRVSLAARGVQADPGHDGYLLAAARKLWVTVVATLGYDNASPVKQAWRRTDLARLAAFCADHDPARMLG